LPVTLSAAKVLHGAARFFAEFILSRAEILRFACLPAGRLRMTEREGFRMTQDRFRFAG
jgi:hypothetical protein